MQDAALATLKSSVESLRSGRYSVQSGEVVFHESTSLRDLLEDLHALRLGNRLAELQYCPVFDDDAAERFRQMTVPSQWRENTRLDDILDIFVFWSQMKPPVHSSTFDTPTTELIDLDVVDIRTLSGDFRACDCASAFKFLEYGINRLTDQMDNQQNTFAKLKLDQYTQLPQRHATKHKRDLQHTIDDLVARVSKMEITLLGLQNPSPDTLPSTSGFFVGIPGEIQHLREVIDRQHKSMDEQIHCISRRVELLEEDQSASDAHRELLARRQDELDRDLTQLGSEALTLDEWNQGYHGIQNYVEDSLATVALNSVTYQSRGVSGLDPTFGTATVSSTSTLCFDDVHGDLEDIDSPAPYDDKGLVSNGSLGHILSFSFIPSPHLAEFLQNSWTVRGSILLVFCAILLASCWRQSAASPAEPIADSLPLPLSSVGEGFMIQRNIYRMRY
ncbi:hypothetical protein BDN72DRAFT_900690 [Pluteus cervinus]|uniref:Uncharacterized protein n=1 Tax=Pluteus cervinus TaxID=181527 RepID=A0ACD3AJT1_9AGAR|nr:hypothetical protein BDN72DRAFT_900690 [Pluteus cervinus]